MSQKIPKKKRLKTSQKTNKSLIMEDSKIEDYFKDYLTFVPDILMNNKNQLSKLSDISEDAGLNPLTVTSKSTEISSKNDKHNLLAVSKKRITDSTENSNFINFTSKNTNSLSATKSPKYLASLKNNKSNLFDNVTDTFSSSKILSLQAISDFNSQKRFELSSWGLPPLILEKYKARGISTMFPWQVECLANRKILEKHRNLVYSAPTSAGKTLISEFLLLKTVLERRKKVIFILPFVSVVREKMFYFQDLLSDSGVRVEGFMGGIAPAGGFSAVHVAIATIEKANSLVNHLMEDDNLTTLGAVVIDELHLLGDSSRGYLLELLLTKLRYMTLNFEHINIQLIGMSATLPNLPLIAEWLDAELYKTDFRPIPLNEQCKIKHSLFDCRMNVMRELEIAPDIVNDTDNIIQLCIETISGGHGVLIFCPTKSWCEKLASQIAYTFFQLGRNNTPRGEILRKNIDEVSLEEVLIQLSHCPIGLDNVLKKTVSFGVAFHHAGLTMDERDIIEGAFRVGALKVLIATSTLSSGVNLPARRVIIRSPKFHGELLDKLTYHQMIGRAGRMGKDTAGESILICQPNEQPLALILMSSPLEPIESCLESSGPLIRALLEAIASEIVRSPADLDFYCKCTFVYKCEGSKVTAMVQEAVQFLIANEFLLLKESGEKEERLVATCLGKACLAASIPPRDALFLFEELQRARKCLVLDTELHVVYLVTPFSAGSQIGQIDWMAFLELWRMLSESERRVGQLVGVEERFLMSAMRGVVKPGKTLNIHRRFYTALALQDLVREVPLNAVCRKYDCCRGLLQSLQQSSSTFAGMVTNFCRELKWDCMELLFAQFQARLQFGVCRDLLDLLRLPSLNGLRARSLFKHGVTTVAELAVASELYVEEALNKALPFESEKNFDGEHVTEVSKRTKMRTVFITGKDGLTAREAAHIVIDEARALVKNELGVCNVQWSQISDTTRASPRSNGAATTSLRTPSIMANVRPSQSASVDTSAANHQPRKKRSSEDPTSDASIEKMLTKIRLSKSSDSLFLTSSDSINDSNKMQVSSGILQYTDDKKSIDDCEKPVRCGKLLSVSCRGAINDNVEPQKALKTLDVNFSAISNANDIYIAKKTDSHQRNIYRNEENDRSKLFAKTNNSAIESRADDVQQDSSKTCDNSTSSEDEINKSDESETTSKTLRSKLLEKTKILLKENLIRTIDFEDKMDLGSEESNKSKLKSKSAESFQISDRAFNEMMQSVERKQDKNILCVPASIVNANVNEDKIRVSADSNYSKSPSLFSDSSFFDPQICSILEKNVMDSECFADFEKNSFTPKIEASRNLAGLRKAMRSSGGSGSNRTNAVSSKEKPPDETSVDLISNRNNVIGDRPEEIPTVGKMQKNADPAKDTRQTSIPLTWMDDSWDNIKNQQSSRQKSKSAKQVNELGEKKLVSDSPSLLQKSNVQGHLRQLITSQMFLSRISKTQAKTSRDASPDLTSISTPKSILRKRAYDSNDSESSPIAGVRSYNTRRPFVPTCNSVNKSDSDESIVSSQTLASRQANVNKTRRRIEQKLGKSLRIKETISKTKLPCTAPKLLKQNTEAATENTQSSNDDTDDVESHLMFDSDNPVKSQTKKMKKLKNNKAKHLKSDDTNTDYERVKLKAREPVNVANSKRTFRLFRSEIEGSSQNERRKDLAIAVVTENCARDPAIAIGNRIIGVEEKKKDKRADFYVYKDKRICGIVISWGTDTTYYMPFGNTPETKITIKERMNFLRDILIDPLVTLRCFNAKETYKMLFLRYEIDFRCSFLDPSVGDWTMNSDSCIKSYSELAAQYLPKALDVSNALEKGFGNYLLNRTMRAAAKSLLAWHITQAVLNFMTEQHSSLLPIYREVEMPTILILANMELRGIEVNTNSLQELAAVIKSDLVVIQERAFRLAGRKFNFYSSKEVSQVLGLNKKGRGCTNKMVLRSCENPISNLVTLWRKLSTVQTKIVFPLLQFEKKNNRIHGSCITHTVTGRVSMHEPNLQTIPRDFESEISDCVLSARMAFIPSAGNLMLSADFCQLELRILAHYSQDPVLCKLMHEEGDIFKNIAARLNQISDEMVNDDMRQRAKQLCYAMVYGMGIKSLAETLSVSEAEAKDYLEAFMGTYKGIRVWLNAVAEQARVEGFVSTIANRRRILSGINSKIPAVKSQAERQAVNTKVQGSAADITKKAMVMIERKLQEKFSLNKPSSALPTMQRTRKLRCSDEDSKPRSAYLVLQLHDELLYEMSASDLAQVAAIVKESMEHAYELHVPLPVKMKVGTAWGNLQQYQV